MKKLLPKFVLLISICILLNALLILVGPISIPLKQIIGGNLEPYLSTILWDIRFPKMITALFAGAALASSGLIMQTYFNNPLAGPFILGVHSGASLGVAIGIMATSLFGIVLPVYLSDLGTVFFAISGSLITLIFLMIIAKKISGNLVLLVMGLVFGHMVGGLINILISISDSHKIKNFLLWTMGSFQRVTKDQLGIFVLIIIICLSILFILSKRLNLLLLGDNYARSSGMNVKGTKYLFLIITAILSGVVTAFCGPIAFIGIISPHIVRGLLKTTNHFYMIPGVILFGGCLGMFSELVSGFMGDITLPLNAVLGLLGGPIILIFLINLRRSRSI